MKSVLIGATALLLAVGGIEAAGAATIYTSDPNLADFTAGVSNYATLSNFTSGDVSSPYTPTTATLDSGIRVYGGAGVVGNLPNADFILATFASAQSSIRVFPNIDHFGSNYDGYQYTIYGSNDGTNFTELFDAGSVAGGGEPFTLDSFFGTAPSTVNNVLTPGSGPGGTVGYIADFSFGGGYTTYAFGASTMAVNSGNIDQELSAVAGVPEPTIWAMLLVGFFGVGGMMRRMRNAPMLATA